MSTISTAHPDVMISNCIHRCLRLTEQAAKPLTERRSFYWRLIHYCIAQIVSGVPAFTLPHDADLMESALVIQVIAQFERSTVIYFADLPDQTILFYKRLHRALSAHVYNLEAIQSPQADQPFDGSF